MAKNTVQFPKNPFSGMRFTDSWRRRWTYDSRGNSWVFDGFVPAIPVADDNTVGLLSPQLKNTINGITEKAGGFGILTKHTFAKTKTNDFNGVLSGDIKLVSDSFDITCVNTPLNPELNRHPVIDINFSDALLDTMCIEVPGSKGLKGYKGEKGPTGDIGTGDGPQGLGGTPGQDAIGISAIEDIEVVFDESFYDSAVTEVILDPESAVLSVTKSDALTPDENTPASEVVALSLARDIEFPDDNTFDYNIITVPGVSDPVPSSIDPITLAYGSDFDPGHNRRLKVAASGCCCEEADSSEVISKRLSDYIDQVIDKHVDAINGITADYDKELKEFVFKKDEEARKALDVLVQKLSDEEFHEKFQYCMSLAENGVCGQCECNELKKFRTDPYNNPGNYESCNFNNLAATIDKLSESLSSSQLSFAAGGSETAQGINAEIINSFDIPTISQNSGLISTQTAETSCTPAASDFDQFTTSICAFSGPILIASGVLGTDDEYCKDSTATTLGSIKLKPGESHIVTTSAGPTLPAGAYIVQYRGGTIYDSDNKVCGYVVGTGNTDLGIVMTLLKNDGMGGVTETEIPWPVSSVSQNPLDPEEVEQAYFLGPITELSIGALVEDGDRIVIEAVATGSNSVGSIELSLFHCSKCT